jgi:hypothetical protein
LFRSHKVEFLVVGGHAVAFHGHPRFTGDIDFLVRPTRENAERVLRALVAFGFGRLDVTVDDLLRPTTVVQLGRPPNRIDLLTSISGVEFAEAWQDKVAGKLDDQSVFFLGLQTLLKNKHASGREKDIADWKKLVAIRDQKHPGSGG